MNKNTAPKTPIQFREDDGTARTAHCAGDISKDDRVWCSGKSYLLVTRVSATTDGRNHVTRAHMRNCLFFSSPPRNMRPPYGPIDEDVVSCPL